MSKHWKFYLLQYFKCSVSAITHYVETANIEKYQDTNKYIVYFKEKAHAIKPIKLDSQNISGGAMQGPRYTSLERLMNAKVLSEVFN